MWGKPAAVRLIHAGSMGDAPKPMSLNDDVSADSSAGSVRVIISIVGTATVAVTSYLETASKKAAGENMGTYACAAPRSIQPVPRRSAEWNIGAKCK